MAWSYSGDPAASARDQIRYLLGDTASADPLTTDAELDYAITQEHGTYNVAAFIAERLAAKFARDETLTIDGISLGATRSAAFVKLAAMLRAQAVLQTTGDPAFASDAILITTGMRRSEMLLADLDPDRVRPAFRRTDDSRVGGRADADRWLETQRDDFY